MSLLRDRQARIAATRPVVTKPNQRYPADGKENTTGIASPGGRALRLSEQETKDREQATLARQRKARLLEVRAQEKAIAADVRQRYREQLRAQRQDAGRVGRDSVLARRHALLNNLLQTENQLKEDHGLAHRAAADTVATQAFDATVAMDAWADQEHATQSRFDSALKEDRDRMEAEAAAKRELLDRRATALAVDRQKAIAWREKQKRAAKQAQEQISPTAQPQHHQQQQQPQQPKQQQQRGSPLRAPAPVSNESIMMQLLSPVSSKPDTSPVPVQDQPSFHAMHLRKTKEHNHYVSIRQGLAGRSDIPEPAGGVTYEPIPENVFPGGSVAPTSADLPLSRHFNSHPFPALELSNVSEVPHIDDLMLRHAPASRALSNRSRNTEERVQREYEAVQEHVTLRGGRRGPGPDKRRHRPALTQGTCITTRPPARAAAAPITTTSHKSVAPVVDAEQEIDHVPEPTPKPVHSVAPVPTQETEPVENASAMPLTFDVPLLPRLAGDSAAGVFLTSFLPERHRPSFAHTPAPVTAGAALTEDNSPGSKVKEPIVFVNHTLYGDDIEADISKTSDSDTVDNESMNDTQFTLPSRGGVTPVSEAAAARYSLSPGDDYDTVVIEEVSENEDEFDEIPEPTLAQSPQVSPSKAPVAMKTPDRVLSLRDLSRVVGKGDVVASPTTALWNNFVPSTTFDRSPVRTKSPTQPQPPLAFDEDPLDALRIPDDDLLLDAVTKQRHVVNHATSPMHAPVHAASVGTSPMVPQLNKVTTGTNPPTPIVKSDSHPNTTLVPTMSPLRPSAAKMITVGTNPPTPVVSALVKVYDPPTDTTVVGAKKESAPELPTDDVQTNRENPLLHLNYLRELIRDQQTLLDVHGDNGVQDIKATKDSVDETSGPVTDTKDALGDNDEWSGDMDSIGSADDLIERLNLSAATASILRTPVKTVPQDDENTKHDDAEGTVDQVKLAPPPIYSIEGSSPICAKTTTAALRAELALLQTDHYSPSQGDWMYDPVPSPSVNETVDDTVEDDSRVLDPGLTQSSTDNGAPSINVTRVLDAPNHTNASTAGTHDNVHDVSIFTLSSMSGDEGDRVADFADVEAEQQQSPGSAWVFEFEPLLQQKPINKTSGKEVIEARSEEKQKIADIAASPSQPPRPTVGSSDGLSVTRKQLDEITRQLATSERFLTATTTSGHPSADDARAARAQRYAKRRQVMKAAKQERLLKQGRQYSEQQYNQLPEVKGAAEDRQRRIEWQKNKERARRYDEERRRRNKKTASHPTS